MPIYEYKCTICNKIYEELQKCGENKPIKCCNKLTKRFISGGSVFLFKGKGWYIP